jgi:hypothetical protein
MQIEFTCPNCRKLLRVAASAAGKRAQCPDCSAVTEVPRVSAPSAPTGDFPGFGPPERAAKDDTSWSTSNWSSEPSSARGNSAANPFSSPESDYAGLNSLSVVEEARNQVEAPAICMIVIGSIILIPSSIFAVMMLFTGIIDAARMVLQQPGEAILSLVILVGVCVIVVGRPILIVYGGLQMRKLQRYPFAIAGAILALISLCSCFIDLAFGIWALVVLCRPRVKQAFEEQKFKTFEQRPF